MSSANSNVKKKDRYSRINQPLDTKHAILLQRELNDNEFATIPDSFMQILHISNGMSCNSSVILGTFAQDPLKDIVSQNIRFDTDKNTLLLGNFLIDAKITKDEFILLKILFENVLLGQEKQNTEFTKKKKIV